MEKIIFIVVVLVISLGIEIFKKRGRDLVDEEDGGASADDYPPLPKDMRRDILRRQREAEERAAHEARSYKNMRDADGQEFYEYAPEDVHEEPALSAQSAPAPAFDFDAELERRNLALEESKAALKRVYATSAKDAFEEEPVRARDKSSDFAAMLKSRESLKTGFIISEVLDKPVSMRPYAHY